MKKCLMSVLLAILITCCSTTIVYAEEQQKKETVLEEKKETVEVGCSSTEIQDLLDLNKDGKYELTVTIPEGTYTLTQTLYVYPNTTIKADEKAILQPKSFYGALLEAQLPKESTGYSGNHDITIEGGIWKQTFVFSNCKDISIRDVVFCNVPEKSQFILLTDVKNVSVSNCKFYGYENWKHAKMSAAIKIDSKDVSCDDITIIGCEFYELSRAIHCEAAQGRYHTNVKVDSNTIHDISDTAIYLKNNKKSRVSGNTITQIEGSGIYITNSPEIRVLNNEIDKAKELGIYLYKSGGKDANNCSKIGNNTIIGEKKGTKKHGIKINSSKYTAVYSNSLTDIAGTGIYVYDSKSCKIGLGTNTSNMIEHTTEHGIYVKKCDGTKIQYNKVSDAKKEGIAVYSSKEPTINRNTISAKKNGILVKDNGTLAKITNNTIKEAGRNGISVSAKCSRVKINGNTIKKYARYLKDGKGIYISQAGGISAKKHSTVSKNKITGTAKSTKKYGIYISNSRYTRVENNTLNYIAGTGIYITNSKNCDVDKNTIKQSKKTGIYVAKNCDNGRVRYNTINKIKGTSIVLKDAPKTLVYANTITALKNKKGIYISGSDEVTIKSNTIKGTKEALAIKVLKSLDCEEKNNTID